MTESPTQPVPPSAETTAAEPGITTAPVEKPVAEDTSSDAAGPATVSRTTLATQELRIAVAFTGGVSLAIWMGGVAREIDLLIQAADRRGQPDAASTASAIPTDAVRHVYQRLVELMDVAVSVDMLAGTSAGGINAAALGLVNARRGDLGPLRDLWLDAGAFDKLLRDPGEPNPQSLLRGDAYLLTELRKGMKTIAGVPPNDSRRTDVFITTTLLSPEHSQFTDSYGTVITDTDHHGMLHFSDDQLCGSDADKVVGPLALAARSSASFPAAFEPAFLPYGADADACVPDVAACANTTRPHWAADGGLLVNRPIAPLMQAIFDRPAERQVRRALLYVVPSSAGSAPAAADRYDSPLTLGEALLRDLGATLNQSIAADLAAIREHNDRVAAHADTRLRLAGLGARLVAHAAAAGRDAGACFLADEEAWADYRRRQGEWLVRPLIAEVTRQLSIMAELPALPALPAQWARALAPGNDAERQLRAEAREAVTQDWPSTSPVVDDAAKAAGQLGRAAFDAAKATVLDLLRSGYILSDLSGSEDERAELATFGQAVHGALTAHRETDLRSLVRDWLEHGRASNMTLGKAVRELAGDYVTLRAPDTAAGQRPDADAAARAQETLSAAWTALAKAVTSARPLLTRLADRSAAEPAHAHRAARPSLSQRRAEARARVLTYLNYFDGDEGAVTARILDLHVAERSMRPIGVDVDQPVELIQVSADTRTLLDPGRATARAKLTGLQLHHFGAFYKSSWRANDWMWGRLDGAGWLAHVLLDPRRIIALVESASGTSDDGAEWFLSRLEDIVGAADATTPNDGSRSLRDQLLGDLAFLNDETSPTPASLPRVSSWVAATLQQHIAAEELDCVAREMRHHHRESTAAGRSWLANYDNAAALEDPNQRRLAIAALLPTCPVAGERLDGEVSSPLFLRTVTKTAAVATAAGANLKQTPAALRPTFATARSITRTAYVATDKTHGQRRRVLLVGAIMLGVGLLAMLTNTVLLGLPGLVLFGAGAVMVAAAVWRSLPRIVATALAVFIVLIAAAPWLPWLGSRLFSWIEETFLPWLEHEKWAWTVLFLLVLLPPLAMLSTLARPRRQ
jgi:patatin-related protein